MQADQCRLQKRPRLCEPTVIVTDASVLVTALADDGASGDHARARLQGERLAFPELAYVEVTSALRRLVAARAVDARRAALALRDLQVLPAQVSPHRPLLHRSWELRDNLTTYDALYVALAEALGATALIADRRLAHAPRLGCPVEVLTDTAN